MTPFLQQIATLFYETYGTDVQQMAFVFPNRRAGLFFRKYLSQAAGRPIFSPAVCTISELFAQLSDKQPADRLQMLFLLYHIYIRHSGAKETFDDFVFWGEMLLNDFDDVDKYMADARQLFTNVTDLHEVEKDLSYLQPQQIEAIRAFWSSFRHGEEGTSRRYFLGVWQMLYAVYRELRDTLAAQGKGYEGMISREVVEHIEREGACRLPYSKVVFVGLSALSKTEYTLLRLLQQQEIADFYWDTGTGDKVMDSDNRASYFVREYVKQFPSSLKLPQEPSHTPDITLIGIPSRIGQAKQVHALLEEVLDGRDAMSADEALRTAVVLPDEQLLIPVLHSVPEAIRHINVTLGYPLSGTPVASLMENVLALRKNTRVIDGKSCFYYREVLPVLNHRYIQATSPAEIVTIVRQITDNNRIYIPAADLQQTPLLTLIFDPAPTTADVSSYLITVLQELNRILSARRDERDFDNEDQPTGMDELEQEFVYHYFTTVNRMRDLIGASGIEMSVDTYARLLERLTETITIPFRGEPLSGLQVMGVLETRVLDFERLIVLSVNEGFFPARKAAASFIPYNLRRGFGLPTYEHQDSIWAYHFYRMIARAKHVTLLYDTRTDGLNTGEVSRYVHQLRYHYEMPLREKVVVYNIASSKPPALQVPKTDEILRLLDNFLSNGARALSASTINTYLDCPLKFYFSSVEQLKEEEEVAESVDNRVFGNILHQVMEESYRPYCGAQVTADLLRLAADDKMLTEKIQRAFAELFFHTSEPRPLSGQSYLTGEMIRKYARKILERDRRLTPFRYVASEMEIHHPFTLTDGRTVNLKGFIDRLDEVRDAIRVVDYKTGTKKDMHFKTVESLFDPTDEKRQPAIMQVFTYAWMYGDRSNGMPVQPSIYYVRHLFSDDFDPSVYYGKEKKQVTDFAVLRDEFEDNLRHCLDEVFDPSVPFGQTTHVKMCSYCPFADICGR
ncbi:PD-(D/E)XK nuclease family protein [Tannerella sp.]|uniref:PD-(D/E)XK nuclease family protein n=1 Tax=Tannerella sp. TaxID=2382127 RepID=UPI0026DC9304|nr:PD-(D/E)XK nuclease family protein [Tannerella sp.]MDO4703220.1 PD-(D/E)XK nuclease family protein [Tannerella sp.]